MSDIQAKFLGLYALALAKVNACAGRMVFNMEQIKNLEIKLDRCRELSLIHSDEHGYALRSFLAIDQTCQRFGLTRRMRLKTTKVEA